MNPREWSWTERDNLFMPTMTDMPPAPNNLLELVWCACKTDCSTKKCTCRKHGLNCSPICGECKRITCYNSPVLNEFEYEEAE